MNSLASRLQPPPLPQRTLSPSARQLHAMLRHCPGYVEACVSPWRIAWAVSWVMRLPGHELPIGCSDAARVIHDALPTIPARFLEHVTVAQLCKMLVEVGYHRAYQRHQEEQFAHEQARRPPARADREVG